MKGVVPHLIENGLSILQYGDDTIIFLDHDIQEAMNMQLLFCIFKQLSGLKINFHKSMIFCFRQAKHCERQYSQLTGCKLDPYPFRYLGLPMQFEKLSNKDLKTTEERIIINYKIGPHIYY